MWLYPLFLIKKLPTWRPAHLSKWLHGLWPGQNQGGL